MFRIKWSLRVPTDPVDAELVKAALRAATPCKGFKSEDEAIAAASSVLEVVRVLRPDLNLKIAELNVVGPVIAGPFDVLNHYKGMPQ